MDKESKTSNLPVTAQFESETPDSCITFMASKRRFPWQKWVVSLLLIGAVVGGAYWYHSAKGDAAPDYQTVPVTRGNLAQQRKLKM